MEFGFKLFEKDENEPASRIVDLCSQLEREQRKYENAYFDCNDQFDYEREDHNQLLLVSALIEEIVESSDYAFPHKRPRSTGVIGEDIQPMRDYIRSAELYFTSIYNELVVLKIKEKYRNR